MKNLFLILLYIISCSGNDYNKLNTQNENNIVIKSIEFKTVLKNFYNDAVYYSPHAKNDTVSVSFYQYDKNDEFINVGLYSFKKLEGRYISMSNLGNLKILFYSNNIKFTEDFIDLQSVKEISKHKKTYLDRKKPPQYIETYEMFFTYKDGQLKLMTLK